MCESFQKQIHWRQQENEWVIKVEVSKLEKGDEVLLCLGIQEEGVKYYGERKRIESFRRR